MPRKPPIHHLHHYTPDPHHERLFVAGQDAAARLAMWPNRAGKSIAGAYEAACHATGDYAASWNGKWFTEHAPNIVIASPSLEVSRDIVQRHLLGFIPQASLGRITKWTGIPDCIDTLRVRHRSSSTLVTSWSTITFISHNQLLRWSDDLVDFLWIDEECGEAAFDAAEALMATHASPLLLTLTAWRGKTPLISRLMADPGCDVITASLDECSHVSANDLESMRAIYPEHEHGVRLHGIPV
jgi:hypothetical protein